MQVAIDADTRLVIATGDAHPGNRNDCTVVAEACEAPPILEQSGGCGT